MKKIQLTKKPRCRDSFSKCEKIFIYGSGRSGRRLSSMLKRLNILITFIDSNSMLWNQYISGIRVISPSEFYDLELNDRSLVVVSVSSPENMIIMKKLLNYGFEMGVDAFVFDNIFEDYYLPQLFFCHERKLYAKNIDLSLTQFCNLRCKECSIRTPYISNPIHEDLDELKKSCESFFEWFNYVDNLYLIGGEPILYPDLSGIVRFLFEQYDEKIGNLIVATNGLVPIKDSLLNQLDKRLKFQISDYSNVLSKYEERMRNFCKCLEFYGLQYTRMSDFEWIDYGFGHQIERSYSFNVEQFFDDCGIDCRGLYQSKLYYCFPAMMVDRVEKSENDTNSYFDLLHFDENRKEELLEFLLGVTETGFINRCFKCNGSYLTNKKKIAVAEQL